MVSLKVTGQGIKSILENGLSQYPKYDGRFPQVSGLKFSFDPSQPVGSRIISDTFKTENGDLIDMEQKYTLASQFFISTGKDGFDAFTDPSVEALSSRKAEDLPTI